MPAGNGLFPPESKQGFAGRGFVFGRRGVFVIRELVVHVVDRVLDDIVGVLVDEIAYINGIDALELLDVFDDGQTR